MSAAVHLVDPYAPTLEIPNWESGIDPADWERVQIARRLRGQYQIVRELGRGGMGVVFLARDLALHRLVAIKVLRQEFAANDEHRERFRREARTTARLSNAGIVPVYGFGERGNLVYIVMKYVHGESLAERLRRERRMRPDDARRILAALAAALDYAHRDGVVHRDLKAENILIEKSSGQPMLTDFGVALKRSLDPVRADRSRAFGTPHYMSPEQAAAEPDIDGRSDLYSLGVLGYQMLTGELPFDGATFEVLAAKHIAEAHRPVRHVARGTPAALARVIERCLEKDPASRWKTGRDMAEALDAGRSWLAAFGQRVAAAVL